MNSKFENRKLREGYSYVIGCDEVGRGCLAGPVVAGAVILDLGFEIENLGIQDSKIISASKREELEPLIKQNSVAWGIGLVDERMIDEINIHNATLLAMKRAVENLAQCHCEPGVHPTEAISPLSVPSRASASDLSAEALAKEEPRDLLISHLDRSLHSSDALLGRDGTTKKLLVLDGKFTIPNFDMEQEAVVDGDAKILSVAAASIIAKVYRDNLMRELHEQYPIYNFAQHKGYGTLFHRTMILQNGLSPIHRKSFCKNLAQI